MVEDQIVQFVKSMYEDMSWRALFMSDGRDEYLGMMRDNLDLEVEFVDFLVKLIGRNKMIINFYLLLLFSLSIEYQVNSVCKVDNTYTIQSKAIYTTYIPFIKFSTTNYNVVKVNNDDKITFYSEVWDLNSLNPLRFILNIMVWAIEQLLSVFNLID